eukprot:gene26556-biopygen16847
MINSCHEENQARIEPTLGE